MGVKGLWEEVRKVHPGRDVSLAELNAEHVESTGRPMRIAVDAAIDIYKYKFGTDHLVCVYDGPGRVAVKRGHRTTGPDYKPYTSAAASSLRSETEKTHECEYKHMVYLSKMFLGYLGIHTYDAPGEGEAECAALEKAGLVDAVMTSDGDAFVFGARTILWAQHAKDGEAMVRVFKTEDLEAAKPRLTQRIFLLVAILAGGDYSKGLRGCSPSLAFKIAEKKPKHCGLLWTLARNPSLRAAQLPKWRKCLAEDLRTSVFGQKYPSIADSLSDKSPN
ncbi:uncharacterized protein PG998_008412 [Apiospora kogelbergensis]|uniref:uncharacterized protein n=1 Tax=Apiospora kogelbergensis TaxID=1337665 RepID=UPI003130DBDA